VTFTALLAAALDDGDALGEVLAAASVVAGTPVSVADLAEAVAAGLAEVDGQSVRFRHPLVRSAVGEAAGLAQRQAMHRALAEVLAGVPDRQVWHRAAASLGQDEEVAAGLEAAAVRAERRGAIAEQAAALAQAAWLSPGSARRGQRLIRAAYAFYELGRLQTALRLLDEAEPLDLDPGDRLRLAWARETMGAATRSGARPLAALADLADQMRQHGDNDQALHTLDDVAIRCRWSNPDRRTRQRMTAVAEAMPVAADDPRLLFVLARSNPAGHGAAVLARLGQHQPGSGTAKQDYFLGYAAAAAGACEEAVAFLTAAAAGLRARGWLGLLGPVLLSQGWSALLLGQAGLAGPAADEAARLLAESGRPLWAACAQLVQAVLAGRRGDAATATELAAQAERVLLTAGVPPLLAQVQLARGTAALGVGRYDEAYEQLARIFDPHDPAYHPHLRAWALADLAEAAAGGRYHDAARRHRAALIPEAAATGSPLLRASLAVAAPMLATGDPQALFDAAFAAGLAALAAAPRPAAARLRHVAAPPPAGRRVPRAAARREGHLRRARRRCLGRARPPGAARRWRAQRPARPARAGPAGPARTAGRAAGRRGADQPGDRPAAVPIAPHRRQPPVPDLPQAGHHVPRRTGGRRERLPRSGVGPPGSDVFACRPDLWPERVPGCDRGRLTP
jgi:tetratricopeptide (TPR) repeat protein